MKRFTPVLLAGLFVAGFSTAEAATKPKAKGKKHEKHGLWTPSARRDIRLGGDRVPAGWSKGEKTGWSGRTVPPGKNGGDSAHGRR